MPAPITSRPAVVPMQTTQSTQSPSVPAQTTPQPAAPRGDTFNAAALQAAGNRPVGPSSTLHFVVHPGMQELKDFGAARSWPQQGWTQVSVPWQDLVYTLDNWKTTRQLNSSDVPSPFINGRILIPNVPKGTEVEFAIHVGLAVSHPHDIGGNRDRGDLWLNNGGQNFRQVTG